MFEGSHTSAILAAKGQGKSVMLASALNDMDAGILLDTIGVYNPRSPYKTAIIPGSTYFTTPEAFLRHALKHKGVPKKSVINLSEYVGEDLITHVNRLSDYLYLKVPMPVLADEVADIMPQQGKGSLRFLTLVKNGRNHRISPVVFATQRPQNMDKNVFDLCDTFYVSMQRAPRTKEYIADLVGLKGDREFMASLGRLKPREFLKYDGDEITNFKVPNYRWAFGQ